MADRIRIVLSHLRKLMGREPDDSQDDGALLGRFVRQHEEAAFAEFVRRHGPMVLGVCRGVLRNADDAFQVTFLTLACKARALRDGQALASWLYRVALRTAWRAKTNAARRCQRERAAKVPSCPDPIGEVDERELRSILHEELNRLPEKWRAPLVLCYLEGKTNEEAARALGWPVGSMFKRLGRGRELLRQRLSRRGFSLPAAALAALLAEQASAAVPVPLTETMIRAALLLASGRAVAGAVSTPVALLLKQTLQAMLLRKMLIASVVLLVLGVLGAASGFALHQAAIIGQPEEQVSEKTRGQPAPINPAPDGKQKARSDRYGDPLPEFARARLGTLRLRHGLVGHRGAVALALSGDGKRVVTVSASSPFPPNHVDNNVAVWDTVTGRERHRFSINLAFSVLSPFLSPDGQVLACGHLGKGYLWDMSTGRELRQIEFPSQNRAIPVFAFTADSKTLASYEAGDATIRVWDVSTGRERGRLSPVGRRAVNYLAWSSDGRSLAASMTNGTIQLWRMPGGEELYQVNRHHKVPLWTPCLAFSPDGETLACDGDKVRLWDVRSGKLLRELAGPQRYAGPVAFSADGRRVVSGSDDGQCYQWDAATGQLLRRFVLVPPHVLQREFHTGGVTKRMALSADGTTLAWLGLENDIVLWDVASGKERHPWGDCALVGFDLGIGLGTVQADNFAFSPDGKRLASMCLDGKTRLWDAGTGQELRRFEGHEGLMARLTFSPDSGTLYSLGRAGLHSWDVATAKEVRRLPGPQTGAYALSPDGKIWASSSNPMRLSTQESIGSQSTIALWDLATGKVMRLLQAKIGQPLQGGHRAGVNSMAFAPDGKTVASVDWRNWILLWDVATGRCLRQFRRPRLQDDNGREWKGQWNYGLPAGVGSECRITFRADGKALLAAYCFNGKIPQTNSMVSFQSVEGANVRVFEWDLATGEAHPFPNIPGKIAFRAFSPDGTALAFCEGSSHAIHIWDLATAKERCQFQGHLAPVTHVAFSPDGKRLASGSLDTTILVWDLSGSKTNSERISKSTRPSGTPER